MAVQLFRGDIFESGAELIACFANGDGIPFGFGVQVAEKNPQAFKLYRKLCLQHPRELGAINVYGDVYEIAYVVVADRMKSPITVEAIAAGLKNLHRHAISFNYKSIAIMAQLDRDIPANEVKKLVRAEFDDSGVMVILYRPLPDADCPMSELEARFIDAVVTVKEAIEYSDAVGTIPAGVVGFIADYGKDTGVPLVDIEGVQVMLKWDEFVVHRRMDGTIVKRGNG